MIINTLGVFVSTIKKLVGKKKLPTVFLPLLHLREHVQLLAVMNRVLPKFQLDQLCLFPTSNMMNSRNEQVPTLMHTRQKRIEHKDKTNWRVVHH